MLLGDATPFYRIYDRFLGKITDDLYLELTKEDTEKDLESLLLSAIPLFEFPRFPLFNYNTEYEFLDELNIVYSKGVYLCVLTEEEIDILSDCMLIEWTRRQIMSIENTRMKYSGSDFKFTSQANHLGKLLQLKEDTIATNKHKQRLYSRRKFDLKTGMASANYSGLAGGVLK